MNYIYCYTNLINGKQYVGQTNNIMRRKKQHIAATYESRKENHPADYHQIFHYALRKYGFDNFAFEILEEMKDRTFLNERENHWIKQRNTLSPNGYNIRLEGVSPFKGQSSKLSIQEIDDIFTLLKQNEKISFISKKYGLSESYISLINNGRCLFREEEEYPLQLDFRKQLEKDYPLIINLLLNSSYTFTSIAKYIGCNRETIRRINNGTTIKVRKYYFGSFPIRKEARSGYILAPVETIPGETGSR